MCLEQFGLSCIEYSDGDMVALSGLIDQLEMMRSECAHHAVGDALWSGLHNHLGNCLAGGQPVNREFIAATVDRLRLIQRQTPEALKGMEDELQADFVEWRSRFAPCLRLEADKASDASVPGGAENPFAREEVFKVFLLDARERLTTAQESCIALEEHPGDEKAIQELFRIFHTFKGECGFFKLASIAELAHAYENLLDMVRNKTVPVGDYLVEVLLHGIDRFQLLIDRLSRREVVIHDDIDLDDIKSEIDAIQSQNHQPIGQKLVAAGLITETEKLEILQKQKETSFTKTFGEVAVEKRLVDSRDIEAVVVAAPADASLRHAGTGGNGAGDQYIKVQAAQINNLVDMIGELIIAQNQVDSRDPAWQSLRKITREIQLSALKLRTTKLKMVALSAHRAVRDVSHQLGKSVNFHSTGDELEVDRDLVEGLGEPLLHMVRNAVHHGIEPAAERAASGKKAEGTVVFDAQRKGNTIIISVEDDGHGLDRPAILRKAVEQGLVDQDRCHAMNDKEVWDLIFRPGFSTAETVSQISGRGVGMDIVRNFVTANRGRIEVLTEPAKFTRINLHFPISTAIIDGMIAMVGSVSVILPVNQVVESLNFSQADCYRVNERIEVINLRGAILPVIDLGRFFDQDCTVPERRVGVVIEDSYQKRYVFLVDQILGKREVVLKSLGSGFKYLKAISSGTVLTGGRIGYVIDPEYIIQESGARASMEA